MLLLGFEFKIDETFTSETNDKICQKLIPQLLATMKPRYQPTYEQLNNWLKALHKHQRGCYPFIRTSLQANLPATSKFLKCIINYNELYIFLKSLYFKFNYFSIIFII